MRSSVRFLLRRLLHSMALLLASSLLCFWFADLPPGDYFEQLRLNPRISAKTVDSIRSQRGLEKPFLVRYWRWLASASRGDWGTSLAYNSPAAPILRYRALNTLLLTVSATLLAWLVSIPIGIFAASHPGTLPDILVGAAVSILLAIPDLVLALLLLLVAARTGVLPAGVLYASDLLTESESLLTHLLLPGTCLAAGLLPILVSHVRNAVQEALRTPYIAAVRAHGIPFGRILLRHALPIAANPLLSLFGLSIGTLLSSSVLVETIFGWPGLGQLTVEAILQRDSVLVIDAAALAIVFLIAGNFIADLLLFAADPRIRADR